MTRRNKARMIATELANWGPDSGLVLEELKALLRLLDAFDAWEKANDADDGSEDEALMLLFDARDDYERGQHE